MLKQGKRRKENLAKGKNLILNPLPKDVSMGEKRIYIQHCQLPCFALRQSNSTKTSEG